MGAAGASARQTGSSIQADELSPSLRRVLHGAFHLVRDPGHARRQAGWRALRATGRRRALPTLRPQRAAGSLRLTQTHGSHVRPESHSSHELAQPT